MSVVKRCRLPVVLLIVPFVSAAEEPREEAGAKLFRKVDPSVVAILHEEAGGSGMILSPDGYILTNGHVVSGATPEDPKKVADHITVILYNDKKYKARVIGHSLDPDVALVKIEPDEPLVPVEIADSDAVRTGQRTYALGMPTGLKRTLTSGIVSNTERTDLGTFTKVIQTDAAINPGNSGGPLFNERGEALGINTYGGRAGLGFTIPIKVAMTLQDHFRRYGRFRRANVPHIMIQELYDELAQALEVKEGMLVDYVLPGSAAEKAGLATGDLIVGVDGQPVSARTEAELSDLNWELVTREIGSTIGFKTLRRGPGGWEEREVSVLLEEDEPAPQYGHQVGEIKESRYDDLGLGVRPPVVLARWIHNLPLEAGVWVTTVEPGSPAAEAGLQENDLITAVEEAPISDVEAFQHQMEKGFILHTPAIRLTALRKHARLHTAVAPDYDLKRKRIALLVPESDHTFVDLLRDGLLASGARLLLVNLTGRPIVTEDRTYLPDARIWDLDMNRIDGLILAGGEGAKGLWDDEDVGRLVREAVRARKTLGGAGAASIALLKAEPSLREKKFTTSKELANEAVIQKTPYTGKEVETDGELVTTTGADKKAIRAFLEAFKRTLLNK
jgi:serine protease Do